MATPDPKDEINRKIQEEIKQLTGQTKRNWQDIYNQIDQSNTSVEALQELLERIEDTVESINGGLDYTSTAFGNIVDKLRDGIKALQFQDTLISKASKIARETLEIRKGESFADISKIKSLQQEAKLNKEILISLKRKATSEGDSDKAKSIEKQIKSLLLVEKELRDIKERDKELNKELGNTPKILSSFLSGLGMSNNALTQAYQNTITLGQGAKAAGLGTQFNAASVFTQQLSSNLKTALGPMAILAFLAKQFTDIFKASDQATGQLAKDFNITYTQASNLRSELNEVAGLTGDIAVNTRGLQESMVAVGKTLGSNAVLNEKDLVFMTKMREQAGFANEELVEMQKFTLATGGNLEDNTKNLMFAAKTTALNNKVLLNEKDIFRDIAKTSNAVKLSVAGGAEALGRAVAQAKALGMSLDQLNSIASGLLDFESSINAELEAQLLTGKNINLDQARLYAINNDMEGLSREIAKNYGSVAKFGQMNRLQQEAAAKAVGMSREDLAKTLVDAEALKGLQGDQAKKAQAALNAARARGMTEEEIAEAGIQDLMKQQSLQDRFNQSVEKLKEIFVEVTQAIMPILDVLAGAFQIVGYIVKGFTTLNPILTPILSTLTAMTLILKRQAIISAVKTAWSVASTAGPFAPVLAAGIIAGAVGYIQSIKDGMINPDGGLVVSGEKGTYSLDKNDTVIAGTDLGKPTTNKINTTSNDISNNTKINTSNTTTNNNQNNNQNSVVSELQQIKNILERQYRLTLSTSLVNPMTAIGATMGGAYNAFNTDKQGTAIAVNTYKTQ